MTTNTDHIDTPTLVVDETVVRNNIASMQNHCDQQGLKFRPHIKTHKSIRLAKMQIEAGAVGINCQKLSEAEVMADAGLDDILITFNIIGELKCSRLLKLHQWMKKLTVTADNPVVIKGLSAKFSSQAKPLNVMIECDTGGGRCGVQRPQDAADLAQLVTDMPGLQFSGLMTYPAAGTGDSTADYMRSASSLLRSNGITAFEVSTGGTPDRWKAQQADVFTEYRAGTYIYNDRSLIARGTCKQADCAATVLATVVSRPTDNRVIVDAGSKTLTSDLLGLNGYGQVIGHADAQIEGLSEEHGTVSIDERSELKVGDQLSIIPNHVCVVSNMLNEVVLKTTTGEFVTLPIDARGCVW